MELQTFLNLAYPVMFLGIAIGGIVSYRRSQHKTAQEISRNASEVQERVINALKSEIDSLKDKVAELEKENVKHKQTFGLIKRALSKKGLTITIDGDLISISDEHGGSIHAQRITGQMIEEAS